MSKSTEMNERFRSVSCRMSSRSQRETGTKRNLRASRQDPRVPGPSDTAPRLGGGRCLRYRSGPYGVARTRPTPDGVARKCSIPQTTWVARLRSFAIVEPVIPAARQMKGGGDHGSRDRR